MAHECCWHWHGEKAGGVGIDRCCICWQEREVVFTVVLDNTTWEWAQHKRPDCRDAGGPEWVRQ